jgi:hypothetical protein
MEEDLYIGDVVILRDLKSTRLHSNPDEGGAEIDTAFTWVCHAQVTREAR